jgi:hypothetical protein
MLSYSTCEHHESKDEVFLWELNRGISLKKTNNQKQRCQTN